MAPAGAGKTFVLAQAVRAWRHDGRQVVLMAHQGKACRPSRTSGRQLPSKAQPQTITA